MIPVVDLLALFFTFPLLVAQFSSFGGYEVTLPSSPLRLPAEEHAVVVKVLPGEDQRVQVWVNQELVSKSDMPERLRQVREEWKHGGDPIALLQRDVKVPVGEAEAILNMLFMYVD